MFTKTELKVIKQTIKLQGIADKIALSYGSCSRNYVGKVLKSETPPKTEMALAITSLTRKLVDILITEDQNKKKS